MASDPQTTARERREAARARFSRDLARALAAHGVTQAEAARVTGAAESIVQRWCDPERHETPSLVDVAHLRFTSGGAAVVRELLEQLAGELRLEVRSMEPPEEPTANAMRRHASLTKELHEGIQAHLLALIRQGPAERSAALKELREAHRELGDVIGMLEREARAEGIVS